MMRAQRPPIIVVGIIAIFFQSPAVCAQNQSWKVYRDASEALETKRYKKAVRLFRSLAEKPILDPADSEYDEESFIIQYGAQLRLGEIFLEYYGYIPDIHGQVGYDEKRLIRLEGIRWLLEYSRNGEEGHEHIARTFYEGFESGAGTFASTNVCKSNYWAYVWSSLSQGKYADSYYSFLSSSEREQADGFLERSDALEAAYDYALQCWEEAVQLRANAKRRFEGWLAYKEEQERAHQERRRRVTSLKAGDCAKVGFKGQGLINYGHKVIVTGRIVSLSGGDVFFKIVSIEGSNSLVYGSNEYYRNDEIRISKGSIWPCDMKVVF